MERAYKFRIYPNKQQQILLAKTFGCSRFVYNYYLNKRIEIYKKDKSTMSYNLCSKDLTQLKKKLEWLKEVDKWALQNSLKDLDNAYNKYFKEHLGFPNFKSKKTNKYSYRTTYTNEKKFKRKATSNRISGSPLTSNNIIPVFLMDLCSK